jgi:hypothetical protein
MTYVGIIVRASIGYYLIKFIVEIIYNFHPWEFLKSRKWEAILMVFPSHRHIDHQPTWSRNS